MTATDEVSADGAAPLSVAARSIPVPTSVSAEAQAMLGMAELMISMSSAPYPAIDDADGWRALAAQSDEAMLGFLPSRVASIKAEVEKIEVAGIGVYVVTPTDLAPGAQARVCLDIHGGGLFTGGGECCRLMTLMAARRVAVPTWGVDYRMPPDHPYPAALDDCLAVYRELLQRYKPENIIVSGGSAGSNLAAALVLRARDEGLPLPNAVVLLTPEVDLTESGDSFATNLGVDSVLSQLLMPVNELYAAGHDLADPYLSPLFGDFSKGYPPTFLQTGTRDLFLSNTVRLHRRLRAAGVEVELHVFEAMPHGGFFGAPEDEEIDAEVGRFVAAHWLSD